VRFETLCRELQEEIIENLRALDEINDYLESMELPFDFFKSQHNVQAGGDILTKEEMEDLEQENTGDNKYHSFEKSYEKSMDAVAEKVALQVGYRHVPWLGVTYFMITIQMILSFLTQFHRKD